MGKVHINSEKQNRKKHGHKVHHLNPIPVIGPGLLSEPTKTELAPEVIKELIEVVKEVPVEIFKTIEVKVPSETITVEKEIIKYIEVEKEVIKMEKYDDSQLKQELNDLYIKCMKLEQRINLLKLFIPIALGIAVIGLFI